MGKNLKRARNLSKLTQLDVADQAGISVNYYARIERGEVQPALDTLEKIFKILRVKSAEILPF